MDNHGFRRCSLNDDSPRENIGRNKTRAAASAPQKLKQAIAAWTERQPDATAIVSPGRGSLSYRAVLREIERIGVSLRHAGFSRDARIATALPAGPDAILAILGITCNAVAVPLDPDLTVNELDSRFELLGLSAVICAVGDDCAARRAAAKRRITVIDAAPIDPGQQGLTLNAPAATCVAPDTEPDADSIAFILQTSGTAGLPKLIPFRHRNMLAVAARHRAWFELTPHDRCLSLAPPYYSHGLKFAVLVPLLTGGSIAVPANAGAIDLTEWFEHLRPTWYSASPTMHRLILDTLRAWPADRASHNLRFVGSGGNELPANVRDDLGRMLGIPVLEHYGSSEAAVTASNLPHFNRPGTCGKPWPGAVRIVGEDGQDLKAGESGEILVGGPTLMSGYLKDDALNRAAFIDGWLRTGDVGSFDADGYLCLHGRIKEIINRGGEKISPYEIEAALRQHSAVSEAAAFAIPHPRLGEDVMAAVVPPAGASVQPDELRRFLQKSLASFKIPRRIQIVDALPKGAGGKVLRRVLSDRYAVKSSSAARKTQSFPAADIADLDAALLAVWRRLLQSDAIGLDDDFFEAGGDSLLAMEALAETERIVGRPVPNGLLFNCASVRGVVANLNCQAPKVATPLKFNEEGSRSPLFFFHGDYEANAPYFLVRLARLLGPCQPIIGIPPHGVGGDPIPATIEAMAADRLQMIFQEQPHGPYRIGGFCNGAMVAFEAARLLSETGHTVEILVLVDAPSTSAHSIARGMLASIRSISPTAAISAWRWLTRAEKASRLTAPAILVYLRDGLKRIRRQAKALRGSRDVPAYLRYQAAMARYRPKPFALPAVFYAGDYGGGGWRRLVPGLAVVPMPGGHLGSRIANLGNLASDLRGRLLGLSPTSCSKITSGTSVASGKIRDTAGSRCVCESGRAIR